jgi:hypothetical protein
VRPARCLSGKAKPMDPSDHGRLLPDASGSLPLRKGETHGSI